MSKRKLSSDAEQLKAEILRSNNPNKELRHILKNNASNRSSSTTFRLCLHLMALFLNDGNQEQLLSKLVAALPNTCITKEGTWLKNTAPPMIRYFFNQIDPAATLTPLSKLSLAPAEINHFIKTMRRLLAEIESDTTSVPNIAKVKAWLDEYQTPAPSKTDAAPPTLTMVLAQALKMSQATELKFREMERLLAQKDTEIAEHLKTIDFLDKEEGRQKEAALIKIAAQLKGEYRDYQTAIDLPMSVELGENMRTQVEKVFAILIRNGVHFD